MFDRPERRPLGDPRKPAVRGQRSRRGDDIGYRARALFVIPRDIGQPRLKPAPPPARSAFWPDDPAAQLDRLLPGQRGAEHRVRCIEQVMPLVEDVAGRAGREFATARGIDHHQRMVGDHQVRLCRRARGAFDEAFAIMRATGIDALATPVGQRGGAVAAEQRGQPPRQIAAHHVAVVGIGGPARDQMRQDRGASRETALQRILQVEQAQVILASLARHHLGLADRAIGVEARRLMPQLTLQRLGVGGDPHRAARLFGPQRRRRKIAERLADPGPRLRQHQVRHLARDARGESARGGGGIGALPAARLRPGAGQRRQPIGNLAIVQRHGARGRARRGLAPFGQPGE